MDANGVPFESGLEKTVNWYLEKYNVQFYRPESRFLSDCEIFLLAV
jgi:hypothetical protein